MRIIGSIVFVSLSLMSFGQDGSALGKKVSELEFIKVLNSEKTTGKLSDFRSKVVVLDFWATWCAPCIESFPHLEELQKEFSNDLTVLTVTRDSEERINRFLEKKKMNLPVVIDTEGKLSSVFPHRLIPHTIVIDKNGFVRAIANPVELTSDVLKRIIKGEAVSISEKHDRLDFDPSKPLSENANFLYQVTVTPYQNGLPSMSDPTGGRGDYKGRRILCTNLSPKSLYEIAYQFPVSIRTVVMVNDRAAFDWSKQTAICFDLIVPEGLSDKRFELMKQHLDFLYDFKPVIEKRQRDVKVLKPIEGQTLTIRSSKGSAREVNYGGSGLSMKNAEIKVISEFLESQFNIPVVDETGLSGLYDLELNWYNEDPKRIHEELRKIGLELKDMKRDVDVLAIYD